MTKSTKTKAVNRTFLLVKSGVNITDARQTVATELGLKAGSTIWHWQRELKMKTPVTAIANVDHNTMALHQNTIDPSIPRTKDHLSRVLTSLVTKDGEYSTKEASAISQVSSNILGFNRFELEVLKFINKPSNKRNATKSVVL